MSEEDRPTRSKERFSRIQRANARMLLTIVDVFLEIGALPFDRFKIRRFLKITDIAAEPTLDQSLEKIGQAKDALNDALFYVDELQIQTEQNKKDVEIALERLAELKTHRSSLEEEIGQIREIAQHDIDAFRKLGGIPSQAEIRRERYIGFFSGVIASVVASVAGWIIGVLFAWLYS